MQIQISHNALCQRNSLTSMNNCVERPKHTKDKMRFKYYQKNIQSHQSWLGLSREEAKHKYNALIDNDYTEIIYVENKLKLISFASFDYLPLLKLLLNYKHQVCISVCSLNDNASTH